VFQGSSFRLEPAGSSAVLDKSAQAGDSLADDQVLHLVRAFVRVERFRIGEEASDVVVRDNAVSAEQLTSPGDSLATLGSRESLRDRRMGVRQFPFRLQLSHTSDQALGGGNVGQHLGKQILHQLE
jgi:hypothetical protein